MTFMINWENSTEYRNQITFTEARVSAVRCVYWASYHVTCKNEHHLLIVSLRAAADLLISFLPNWNATFLFPFHFLTMVRDEAVLPVELFCVKLNF